MYGYYFENYRKKSTRINSLTHLLLLIAVTFVTELLIYYLILLWYSFLQVYVQTIFLKTIVFFVLLAQLVKNSYLDKSGQLFQIISLRVKCLFIFRHTVQLYRVITFNGPPLGTRHFR